MRRGLFVVIEGIDASGKSTLVRSLTRVYRNENIPLTIVREPGGTRLSEQARRILLNSHDRLTAASELFLYLAARSQLVDEVIRPALERGELVISDRFSLSTFAYQIGGRGLPARDVVAADRMARDGVVPDITIVLSVTESEARRRQANTGAHPDRMERERRSFFRRVRSEYAKRTKNAKGTVVIDSALGPERVFEVARSQIDRRLKRNGLKAS